MDLTLYGFQGLSSTYNVHPAFVHFPIALLPTMLLLYTLGIVFRSRALCIAGQSCLLLGLVSVAITVTTGLLAEDSFPHNDTIHHMMETHEMTAFVVLGLTALLALWSFVSADHRPRAPLPFLVVGALASYFVLQNGDIGGRMVYLQGAAVRPAVPVVGEGHHHGEAAEEEEQEDVEVQGSVPGHEHHHGGREAHPHEHAGEAEE